MQVRQRLGGWHARVVIALTILSALLLPSLSEAGCLQAGAAGQLATPVTQVQQNVVRLKDVGEQPQNKPSSPSRHAMLCQHAHCGHSQVAHTVANSIEPVIQTAPLNPVATSERLVSDLLAAGPERPPQA
jgi:hypothetical protein